MTEALKERIQRCLVQNIQPPQNVGHRISGVFEEYLDFGHMYKSPCSHHENGHSKFVSQLFYKQTALAYFIVGAK